MILRITTLSENTASRPGLLAEWGLSVVIEANGATILFDTGQGVSASHNAGVIGVDMGTVKRIVLSHGHHDHTGGLRDILGRMNRSVEIVAHPDIWQAKYSRREGQPEKYIGIPFQREELESLGARFNLTREPVTLGRGIMTTGEIPMVTDFESTDPAQLVRQGNAFERDALLDDQAIVIKAGPGLVVVLGCAHRGAINTLYHARRLTGVDNVHMVIGGAHLVHSGEERVGQTISALKELGVTRVGMSHCTGLPAAVLMAQAFGEGFFFNNAGTVVEMAGGA